MSKPAFWFLFSFFFFLLDFVERGGKPRKKCVREFWERVLTVARCRLSGALWWGWQPRARNTTALPYSSDHTCPRSRVPCRLFVVYPGVLSLQATGCPSRVRHTRRIRNPASSPLCLLRQRRRAEYGSSLPTCPLGFRLGYKGSLDLWPRYRFQYPYRVAPRLPFGFTQKV